MPAAYLKPSIKMLQYSRARIDLISLVDIGDVVELADDGIVYMAANHDIGALLAGLVHDSFFKGGDEADGTLHLILAPLREGPIVPRQDL